MSEEAQVAEEVNMKQLLEAGVHFGHQKSHWNPKMQSYIFGARNGIHIIDLQQTVGLFKKAYEYVRSVASEGGDILFIGTKKQAQGIIEEEAIRCGMPYINTRWLGGTLTNFNTIRSRVDYLMELTQLEENGEMKLLPKKEAKDLRREKAKLQNILGGIVNMKRPPDAVFIVDTRKESIAVKESRNLDIPIVAVVDTNCDPATADLIIPSNDDAIRAIKLFTEKIADACIEGRHLYEEKLTSGEIEKPKEEKSEVIVERKVFVFKDREEGKEEKAAASVAVSESSVEEKQKRESAQANESESDNDEQQSAKGENENG